MSDQEEVLAKLHEQKHAYPFVYRIGEPAFITTGMSLREHYAGLALQGIMANPRRWADIERRYLKGSLTYEEASMANARKAVSLADALLKALEDS